MRLALAKWTLGPLLLAQGRRVRRVTPVLPEPPGPREGETGEGPLLRLLVLGDSAGAGVGAASQDEALTGRIVAGLRGRFRVHFRLVASTGATTASTIRHLERGAPFAVDAVVTSLGVNDVTGDVGVARFLELQARLHALLREQFGARLVLASGIPPMDRFPALPQPLRWYLGARARELDRALAAALPDGRDAEYLAVAGELDAGHMAADGFHPGPAVYAAWGAAAAGRIARAFDRDGKA
ncbi:MAG: SGNH/GDSL hydrolase family protein [Burkholderiales bacterium]|nr:SGNH/GDSL hydrolase family protein [Burkholderiales bacterium]MCL4689012.1 SGNH/GDSL hydrolase family protein [Burkholderiales bacterium]